MLVISHAMAGRYVHERAIGLYSYNLPVHMKTLSLMSMQFILGQMISMQATQAQAVQVQSCQHN